MEAIIRNRRGMTLGLALALTAAGALSAQTAMGAPKKVPAAQPKPAIHAAKRPAVQVVRHVPLPRKRPLPAAGASAPVPSLSLIHISEPTRLGMISYAVFCLKK